MQLNKESTCSITTALLLLLLLLLLRCLTRRSWLAPWALDRGRSQKLPMKTRQTSGVLSTLPSCHIKAPYLTRAIVLHVRFSRGQHTSTERMPGIFRIRFYT